MRSTFRILVVAAMAFGVVGVAAVPGGAGTIVPQPVNTVIVEKEVTGTVPTDTVFTVAVTCGSQINPGAAAPIPDQVITFDATGTPTSDNSLTTSAGTECTAVETASGGATSTTYACDMVHGLTDDEGPPFLGNCVGGDTASFGDVIGDTATITVTNNFPTAPPLTPAAQAVQAAPAFTG
ncbi:MAG TPA: hypothetical protein VGN51_22405 [Acidimicrobiia bacterium]|jgi:hypothetical protein